MSSVHVVFHIDEMEKWSVLLANVRNLLVAVDVAASKIEVLVNAKAALIFAGKAHLNDRNVIESLAASGVQFVVCQNSLRGLNIATESLPTSITTVAVGVLELIHKQASGYAYIKP